MYTDPGVISMIIAAVVGSVVAIPAYLLFFKNKIRGWLSGKDKRDKKE